MLAKASALQIDTRFLKLGQLAACKDSKKSNISNSGDSEVTNKGDVNVNGGFGIVGSSSASSNLNKSSASIVCKNVSEVKSVKQVNTTSSMKNGTNSSSLLDMLADYEY